MSEQTCGSDQDFSPPPAPPAGLQMLFEDVNGVPMARLPRDRAGNVREPDGRRYLSLADAVRHFNRPEAWLRNHWRASWSDWLSPADEAAIAGAGPSAESAAGAAAGEPSPGVSKSVAAAAADAIRQAVAGDLLRQVVCPHLSDEMFAQFVEVCERRHLDPLMGQAIADVRYDRFRKRQQLNVITPISTFRLIAQRTGRYAGQTRPVWSARDGKWLEVWPNPDEPPYAAAVGVRVRGESDPAWGVVYWKEYAPYYPSDAEPGVDVLDEFWAKMPCLMLAKVAEAAAFRKAFPEELGGLFSPDEMRQADGRGPNGGRGNGGPRWAGGGGGPGNRLEPREPIRDNHDYAERLPPAAAPATQPAPGVSAGCPHGSGPQVVYDTPTAVSERDAHLALVDMGFCRPAARQRLVCEFDSRMPGLRERNPARFWQVLLRDVGRDPSRYGGHAVAAPSPA